MRLLRTLLLRRRWLSGYLSTRVASRSRARDFHLLTFTAITDDQRSQRRDRLPQEIDASYVVVTHRSSSPSGMPCNLLGCVADIALLVRLEHCCTPARSDCLAGFRVGLCAGFAMLCALL
ncbi:uncharacterized protein LAESUDRAFT_154353 [Laetiporus sulphureus 93-53]|uniref:Uncharacterized protein n=1 Tax=Laetiporus sulphureus 93-53 TaxID=1314785 RepID=A0A165HK96_9APHY|nr:uncharacterized protein LAESUDRAFT_154353 [Laetiporus sulphureus 93-53]KZT11840.1 hypothetical protein LAESUDRAFT_154353 [Laetiporus sulphureus 93-53]